MLKIEFGYTYENGHDVLSIPVDAGFVCVDPDLYDNLKGFAASMVGIKKNTFVRRGEISIDYVEVQNVD